jgi:hypothetical protein
MIETPLIKREGSACIGASTPTWVCKRIVVLGSVAQSSERNEQKARQLVYRIGISCRVPNHYSCRFVASDINFYSYRCRPSWRDTSEMQTYFNPRFLSQL